MLLLYWSIYVLNFFLPEKEEKFKPLKVDPPSTKLDNSVTLKDYERKLLCYELPTLFIVIISKFVSKCQRGKCYFL